MQPFSAKLRELLKLLVFRQSMLYTCMFIFLLFCQSKLFVRLVIYSYSLLCYLQLPVLLINDYTWACSLGIAAVSSLRY